MIKFKHKHKSIEKRVRKQSRRFLYPSLLGVLIFFGAPFLIVIYYSFIDNVISKSFVSFENYKYVYENLAFRQAVKNTLTFSGVAVPLAVIVAMFLAILLDRDVPFKSAYRTFFLSPLMVPVASVVLIFQVLFSLNGSVNHWLSFFNIDPIDYFSSDYALMVVVLLFLWKNIGYNMIIFMAAIAQTPNDLIEAAKLDGANKWQIFFKIKMRFLSSSLVFVTIMSLISSFKIFREIYMLTTDYPQPSIYVVQHFMNNKFTKLDYQALSSAAVLMSIVIAIIVGILIFAEERYGKDVEG